MPLHLKNQKKNNKSSLKSAEKGNSKNRAELNEIPNKMTI